MLTEKKEGDDLKMPEYDEETQAKITGTFYLLIIDVLCSWGVVLTIILIFATAADQARKEFNDAESATQDTEKEIRSVYLFMPQYPHKNSPNWSLYISFNKEWVERIW